MRFTRCGTDFLPKTLRFIQGKSIRCYIHYELTDHAMIRRLIKSRSSRLSFISTSPPIQSKTHFSIHALIITACGVFNRLTFEMLLLGW